MSLVCEYRPKNRKVQNAQSNAPIFTENLIVSQLSECFFRMKIPSEGRICSSLRANSFIVKVHDKQKDKHLSDQKNNSLGNKSCILTVFV